MTDTVMNEIHSNDQTSRERATRASDAVRKGLKKRYAAEARFKAYGIGAIGIALAAVVVLFYTIISSGLPAFTETTITLNVEMNEQVIDPTGTRDPQTLNTANYRKVVFDSLLSQFPEVTSRRDRRDLTAMLSSGASFKVQKLVTGDPSLIGQVVKIDLPVAADFDLYKKGVITKATDELDRKVSNKQMVWFDNLL